MNAFPRIASLLACLTLAACGGDEAQAPPAPRPVLTMQVGSAPHEGPGFAGTVEARYQTARGFQVLGRIESVDVDVGDLVTNGRPLARLDPTSFQLDVNSKIGDLARAEARLKNAGSRMERTRRLLSSGSSTQAQLEADVQAHAAAQAAVGQANAELAKARTSVGYTILTSDEDGVVVSRQADVGRTVNPGQPVMTIARTGAREVVVDVPESVAGSLSIGETFGVLLQADRTITARGRVREIAPQLDDSTRTRRVRITLDSPPEPFRLGATVTARRDASSGADAVLTIPSTAVTGEGKEARVWVVDPQAQAVRSVPVEIRPACGRDVQVSNGLSAGQFIVVAGVSDLKDGQKIVFDGAKAP